MRFFNSGFTSFFIVNLQINRLFYISKIQNQTIIFDIFTQRKRLILKSMQPENLVSKVNAFNSLKLSL